MSSAIFFKFKSQKEPQRITFDGTHLSVFEVKREIIRISNLGDGSDFDLAIYPEDSSEGLFYSKADKFAICFTTATNALPVEYNDDTAIIPRSTTVICRRLPPPKPGHGRAARYVSGRMPTTVRNSHRIESTTSTTGANKQGRNAGASAMEKAQTEEERIAAMLQMGADQWEEQKQQMAKYVRAIISPILKHIANTSIVLHLSTGQAAPRAENLSTCQTIRHHQNMFVIAAA